MLGEPIRLATKRSAMRTDEGKQGQECSTNNSYEEKEEEKEKKKQLNDKKQKRTLAKTPTNIKPILKQAKKKRRLTDQDKLHLSLDDAVYVGKSPSEASCRFEEDYESPRTPNVLTRPRTPDAPKRERTRRDLFLGNDASNEMEDNNGKRGMSTPVRTPESPLSRKSKTG